MADRLIGKLGTGVMQQSASKQELYRKSSAGQSFQTLLDQQLQKNAPSQPLKFSKHAQERMQQRGIELSTAQLTQLRTAVEKARDKGTRDLLVLEQGRAFIVNVQSNTVVTSISGSDLKENIFTHIDSAVLI